MPTIIVEVGTAATSTANSYVTVAEVTTFCDNHGLTSWATLSEVKKQRAILRGMAFVESEFDFKGTKMDYSNPLEWPRFGVYDISIPPETLYDEMMYYQEIPPGLKKAVCRAAYEESVEAGVLQQDQTSNIKKEKIDVIEIEYWGVKPSKTLHRQIEGFLKGLLKNTRSVTVLRT